MSQSNFRVPKFCFQKSTGQAYVTIRGKRKYLGRFNSAEAQAAYEEVVEDLRRQCDASGKWTTSLNRLALEFIKHAETYYLDPDGVQTPEVNCYQQALRPLLRSFGNEPASKFGPKKLAIIQSEFAEKNVRTVVNRHISRIRSVFGWGVAQEMVPAEVADSLKYLPPLKAGRCAARESEGVHPVSMEDFNSTLPFLTAVVRAMVIVQLKTGARPSEIRLMKQNEIDTSGDIWIYRPTRHKNACRGKMRVIQIGPTAQAVLQRFMEQNLAKRYFFTPEADARNATAGSHQPYTLAGYRRCIIRACGKAGVKPWTPNQLRHTAATEIRKYYDTDAARAVLGHADKSTTEIYAEQDLRKAAEVIAAIG